MNIKSLIQRFMKESATAVATLQYYSNQPIWTPKEFKKMAEEGYKGNVYVYACIKQIAMGSAGIPWILTQRKKTSSGKDNEIETHPLLDLWNKPNMKQGGTKFREAMIAYLMIEGNSYIESVGPNNPNKPPIELYTLRPDRITILPGDKQNMVRGYVYTVGDRKQTFDQPNILHLLQFDPLDDWYGMSPLKAASRSVDQNNQSRAWNVALLQNGARPPGILKTEKGLTDTQHTRLESKWHERYAGWENAGTPIILEGGLEWQEMGLNAVDMAWIEGVKLSAREIAIAFGVPPEIIGDSNNKTYSNYKEARKAFYEETILPLMDWMRDEINNWLTIRYGDNLYLDYDTDSIEALQEDRDKVWTRVNSSVWLKVNEKRAACGYDDLTEEEGGNLILVPTSVIPIETYLAAPDNSNESPKANLEPDPTLDENASDEDLTVDENTLQKAIHFNSFKAFNLKSEEQRQIHWKSVEIQRTPYYKNADNIIKKQFERERKAITKIVRNSHDSDDALTKTEKYLKNHQKEWTAILKGIYYAVGEVFAKQVVSSIKEVRSPFGFKAFGSFNMTVDDWLKNNSSTKVVQINETTRDNIKTQLSAGVEQGESIDELADRIDTLYLEKIIPNRSTVIARTEVISASNLGSRAGAKETGLELEHEWLATGDKRCRQWHRDANRQTQPLDEPFIVKGQKLMFPGDISFGASADNIIQCRCTETYSVPD